MIAKKLGAAGAPGCGSDDNGQDLFVWLISFLLTVRACLARGNSSGERERFTTVTAVVLLFSGALGVCCLCRRACMLVVAAGNFLGGSEIPSRLFCTEGALYTLDR